MMSLITRPFPEMVVPFQWSLEPDDSFWNFRTQFFEIVDPMGAERGSVADELSPYCASQPVIDCDIPDRVDRNHSRLFYNKEKNKKIRKTADASGSLDQVSPINQFPNRSIVSFCDAATAIDCRKNFLLRVFPDVLRSTLLDCMNANHD